MMFSLARPTNLARRTFVVSLAVIHPPEPEVFEFKFQRPRISQGDIKKTLDFTENAMNRLVRIKSGPGQHSDGFFP